MYATLAKNAQPKNKASTFQPDRFPQHDERPPSSSSLSYASNPRRVVPMSSTSLRYSSLSLPPCPLEFESEYELSLACSWWEVEW